MFKNKLQQYFWWAAIVTVVFSITSFLLTWIGIEFYRATEKNYFFELFLGYGYPVAFAIKMIITCLLLCGVHFIGKRFPTSPLLLYILYNILPVFFILISLLNAYTILS